MSDCGARSARIVVRGVRALGRHGALPRERDHPQPFDVDVLLDVPKPGSDDLAQTIDYSVVVAVVRQVVAEQSFALVESLANAIASRMLGLGATGVTVRVAKPGAARSLGVREVVVEVCC